MMAVKCQASSLLGRLETLGPGGTAALRRRQQAGELERRWLAESRAQQLAERGLQGSEERICKAVLNPKMFVSVSSFALVSLTIT